MVTPRILQIIVLWGNQIALIATHCGAAQRPV
jgi:hypothetical protein